MPEFFPNDAKAPVRFISSLKNKLIVRSVKGKEKMGRLFVFNLELISDIDNLDFDKVVGQQVTIVLVLDEFKPKERFFNGYITEFKYLGFDGKYNRYQAKVRPWLWLLTRTSDCRIFQNKKVPDIIKEVFKFNNMVDYRLIIGDQYRVWENCVQYNESDFDFVSRLMEQEGIYYYFEHQENKHVMVLTDGSRTHEKYPDYEQIQFDQGFHLRSSHNSLDTWAAKQSIMPNRYAVQDYDFKKSTVNLLAKYTKQTGHAWPIDDPEIFDYPGEYEERQDGSNYAEIRLQELQCQQERMHAAGNNRGLSPGFIFELTDYPRADQNREYLTISVEHDINNHEFITNESSGKSIYRCQVEVMDKTKLPFRTPRKTPKPIVRGPQTAHVVVPEGDEILTDQYGRVKVQFHWDRYGNKDENSSCWVRVSQGWAGQRWGAMHIPRKGQEVIVSFLEGDPDRPIITGRVYNSANMPPYDLDQNKTQSGIKSRSTLEGGPDNFNEIRMEDKIGEEELYIQAEKDEKILVKNDKSENVGHNEGIAIGNDRSETVGNNESITVGNNRVESVGSNETLAVGKNRTRSVGINEAIAIGAAQEITVGASQTITVGASQTNTVGANQSVQIGSDRELTVGSNQTTSVAKNDNLEVGKNLVIDAGDSITIKCGSAQITMKKNGEITIKGKDLNFKASGKINAKASSDVSIKGSKVAQN